jgi:hypothetical protein
MMYQYVREDYTRIKLKKDWEKVKVVFGEIIESDLDELYFLSNGFKKIVSIDKKENGNGITIKASQRRKKK